jgi:hypothetical protein
VTAIKNTSNAYGATGVDQTATRRVDPILAATDIEPGDVVTFVNMTADTVPSVRKSVVASDVVRLVAGVAVSGAKQGQQALICRSGPAVTKIGNATPTIGQLATFHGSTNGAALGVTPDATTVVGATFGVFLSAELGSTDTAILDVRAC